MAIRLPVHAPGGLGLIGLLVDGNHSLHIIMHAFAGCDGFLSVITRVGDMEDVVFRGVLVAAALLFSAVVGVAVSIYRMISSLHAKNSASSPEVEHPGA